MKRAIEHLKDLALNAEGFVDYDDPRGITAKSRTNTKQIDTALRAIEQDVMGILESCRRGESNTIILQTLEAKLTEYFGGETEEKQ